MRPLHKLLLITASLMLTAMLGACGAAAAHTASGSTTTSDPAGSRSGGGGNGSFPGASGSVAQISASSMEVQSQESGQVTVDWTSTTSFTESISVAASKLATGDCVTVTGSTSDGQLTANSVIISQPSSSGSCTTGFGGGTGGGGGRFPGGSIPNGGSLPSRPSGSIPGGGSGFSFASGTVASVSQASLVIFGISSSGFTPGSQSSTPPTSIQQSNVKVALTSSTHYSETQDTAASSLAVGDCVTATGSSTSTGAVTARSVRITSTGGQTCTSGFAPGGIANG
jgi:hypothetical protein